MQRLSNIVLSIALTVFVIAASLALIAAAWLIATQFLDGQSRWLLPKWLFIGLLTMMSITKSSAQTVGAFVVVEERITQSNKR
jgi:F0F1-type ATP synthase assembly protein I